MVDYYNILQIESNANEQEIKRAFRSLAKQYHPDVNHSVDAPEKFKLVYMAYEVLSDAYKKRLYDELKAESTEKSYNTSDTESSNNFNYDAGFDEWEHRAKQRAEHFSNMRYEQFKKQELRGLDFIYHQFALFFGIICLFIIGGGALYFTKTILIAVYNNESPPAALFGALIVGGFGITILWYVTKMSGVFRKTFAAWFRNDK